jgi:dCTP deaminase
VIEVPNRPGVLPDAWLEKAISSRTIASDADIPVSNIQPASLDLRLGDVAYVLRSSFLPGPDSVEHKLRDPDLAIDIVSIEDSAVLEPNRPYLIPLQEHLRLPRGIRARANPKSSTGRLDIFTRVITDRGARFDDVRAGYQGKLFLEIVSRSFPIRVRKGLSLNQIRLMTLQTSATSDQKLRSLHKQQPLLFYARRGVSEGQLTISNGLFMSLDLSGDESGFVGYRARRNSKVLDLALINEYEASDFWDPVLKEHPDRVVLEPEEFYLLLSAEAVRVPSDFAAEMTAYDPTSGELRTHYAGFFDPGFGQDYGGLRGSRATLEVRAHDVPFMIEGRQRVCKLTFEPMLEPPRRLYGQDVDSNYQGQTVTLSKHFRADRPYLSNQPRLPFWS